MEPGHILFHIFTVPSSLLGR